MINGQAPRGLLYRVSVQVSSEAEEIASALLIDLGVTGVATLSESDTRSELAVYLRERPDAERMLAWISEGLERGGISDEELQVSVCDFPEEDWMEKWKEGFEPREVGGRWLIAPSWRLPSAVQDRILVQIDPGMAFGTGTHETTQLCLLAIERHWTGGTVLDVGTGSGILAIAAAKLEPQAAVTAIDIDPEALAIARENVIINGVDDRIEVLDVQIADLGERRFDLIVANLTVEALVELVAGFGAMLKPSGRLILSGILTERSGEVSEVFIRSGLDVVERQEAGEWASMVAWLAAAG
ncbi:MAG: 50S ribosomal protein L11 methyltransferase [Acidobacteria bacterium]|nr:50S ribosomal protein L11 methyltransferase [Acidobacteriota bacterium]